MDEGLACQAKGERVMANTHKLGSAIARCCIALCALTVAGMAQARDHVAWSIGVGVPGVQVGVSNRGGGVYVAPAPVVYANQPVYYQQPAYAPPVVYAPAPRVYYSQPAVVYSSPAVVYQTAPVVYAPPAPYYRPVYVAPTVVYRGGWGHRHHVPRGWDHGHRR
jgi:hypothetical protein